jgi:hypothetical protein
MNYNKRLVWLTVLAGLVVSLASATAINGQQIRRGFLSRENKADGAHASPLGPHNQTMEFRCSGEISRVEDVGFEGVKVTSANWGASPGGGDGGRYDKTPILSTRVRLEERVCLNAHLSAIVGSRQTYPFVSRMTMFQVTLTPIPNGAPQHMIGHYDFPYGQYGPAVALSAEYDVDMYASNFFQRVGKERGDVPPGDYQVDVWWAGGPIGGGGAIGAAFVLKLYFRK